MITSASSSTRTDSAVGAAAPASVAGGVMGKDAFMKLLIAQMRNQDPMSPMQGDQMAAQLAQFSSLEQLQQINTTLTGQQSSAGTLLGAIQAASAINSIGHTVMASGNQVQIGGTGGATTVTANIGTAATTATLHVFDSTGKEVGTRALGAVNGGTQSFDLGSAVSGLAPGTYTYSIDAKGVNGAVTVQTYTTGKVDGVRTGQDGLVLTAGGLTIPYASVVQIFN